MTESKQTKQFHKWWRKNHHRKKSHYWLVKYTRHWSYTYSLAPEAFSEVQNIAKRFLKSEYQRLSYTNARTLWRLSHPQIHTRNSVLLNTAARMERARLAQKEPVQVVTVRRRNHGLPRV